MCCNVKSFIECDEWFVSCSDEDVQAICESEGIEAEDYFFLGIDGGKENNSLRTEENGDCVFRTESGCGIYSVRPSICKKFAESTPCLFFPERSTQLKEAV